MNCPNCGKQIPENALVCPECGATIGIGGTLGAAPVDSRMEEPLTFSAAAVSTSSVDEDTSDPTITITPSRQTIAQQPWFKIACAVVVVILCVVVILAAGSRSRNDEEAATRADVAPTATATTQSAEDRARQATQSKVMSDVKNAANVMDSVKSNNGGTLEGVTTLPCTGTADSPGVGSVETSTSSAAYTCSSGVSVSVAIEPSGRNYTITAVYEADNTAYTFDSATGVISPSNVG